MSFARLRAIGALVVPLALAALLPATAAAQATGGVRGRVLENGGQQPISDVQVTVVGTTLGAVTNAAGEDVITHRAIGCSPVPGRVL